MILLIGGWWSMVLWRRNKVTTESMGWPSVMGTMISHRAGPAGGGDDGDGGFEAMVGYTYSIDGTGYSGSRVQWSEPLVYPDHATALDLLQQEFPVHKPVRVYYDPKDPSRSCLKPTPDERPLEWLVFGGGVFTIAVMVSFGLVLIGDRGGGFDSDHSR